MDSVSSQSPASLPHPYGPLDSPQSYWNEGGCRRGVTDITLLLSGTADSPLHLAAAIPPRSPPTEEAVEEGEVLSTVERGVADANATPPLRHKRSIRFHSADEKSNLSLLALNNVSSSNNISNSNAQQPAAAAGVVVNWHTAHLTDECEDYFYADDLLQCHYSCIGGAAAMPWIDSTLMMTPMMCPSVPTAASPMVTIRPAEDDDGDGKIYLSASHACDGCGGGGRSDPPPPSTACVGLPIAADVAGCRPASASWRYSRSVTPMMPTPNDCCDFCAHGHYGDDGEVAHCVWGSRLSVHAMHHRQPDPVGCVNPSDLCFAWCPRPPSSAGHPTAAVGTFFVSLRRTPDGPNSKYNFASPLAEGGQSPSPQWNSETMCLDVFYPTSSPHNPPATLSVSLPLSAEAPLLRPFAVRHRRQ